MSESTENYRRDLVEKLFPVGIPKLWCPPLTHYSSDGSIDKTHIKSHLTHMAPYVKTHLIPGSTGDGWELSEAEIKELLEFIVSEGSTQGIRFLVGVLRPDADTARRDIIKTAEWLTDFTGTYDFEKTMAASGVCGFNVCASGGKYLSQKQIKEQLAAILALGYPTALYQIPQFTNNEIAPETFSELADEFGNLYMWKDTSGNDTVSLSRVDTGRIFMVRGMEKDYSRWYKSTPGGLYDGFLLGSANCFAHVYRKIIDLSDRGMHEEAQFMSDRVTRAVAAALEKASGISFGNAFANSNKAFDHFFAYGCDALKTPLPMTHSGNRLPEWMIKSAGMLLENEKLMPDHGYMQQE